MVIVLLEMWVRKVVITFVIFYSGFIIVFYRVSIREKRF